MITPLVGSIGFNYSSYIVFGEFFFSVYYKCFLRTVFIRLFFEIFKILFLSQIYGNSNNFSFVGVFKPGNKDICEEASRIKQDNFFCLSFNCLICSYLLIS